MFKLRVRTVPTVAAGVATLMLGAGGVAVAESAPDAQALAGKSTRTAKAPAASVPRPEGHIVSGAGTGAPPAALMALSQDGACETDDLCLSFFRGGLGWGSWFDTPHNEPNLHNNRFITAGAGQWQPVRNNAQGYWNRGRTYVRVCDDVNYTGVCAWLAPNSFGDLPAFLSDRVESFIWNDQAN